MARKKKVKQTYLSELGLVQQFDFTLGCPSESGLYLLLFKNWATTGKDAAEWNVDVSDDAKDLLSEMVDNVWNREQITICAIKNVDGDLMYLPQMEEYVGKIHGESIIGYLKIFAYDGEHPVQKALDDHITTTTQTIRKEQQ